MCPFFFWLKFGTMGRFEKLAVIVSNFLYANPILAMSFWSWTRIFDGMLAVFLSFHSQLYSYSLHFAVLIWGMFTIVILTVRLYQNYCGFASNHPETLFLGKQGHVETSAASYKNRVCNHEMTQCESLHFAHHIARLVLMHVQHEVLATLPTHLLSVASL